MQVDAFLQRHQAYDYTVQNLEKDKGLDRLAGMREQQNNPSNVCRNRDGWATFRSGIISVPILWIRRFEHWVLLRRMLALTLQ